MLEQDASDGRNLADMRRCEMVRAAVLSRGLAGRRSLAPKTGEPLARGCQLFVRFLLLLPDVLNAGVGTMVEDFAVILQELNPRRLPLQAKG